MISLFSTFYVILPYHRIVPERKKARSGTYILHPCLPHVKVAYLEFPQFGMAGKREDIHRRKNWEKGAKK